MVQTPEGAVVQTPEEAVVQTPEGAVVQTPEEAVVQTHDVSWLIAENSDQVVFPRLVIHTFPDP